MTLHEPDIKVSVFWVNWQKTTSVNGPRIFCGRGSGWAYLKLRAECYGVGTRCSVYIKENHITTLAAVVARDGERLWAIYGRTRKDEPIGTVAALPWLLLQSRDHRLSGDLSQPKGGNPRSPARDASFRLERKGDEPND